MVRCCVTNCSSKRGEVKGVSFHEFPTSGIRTKWIEAISRVNQGEHKVCPSVWYPKDQSVVCSLHFETIDYKSDKKMKILCPTAIPSNFSNFSSCKVKDQKSMRIPLKRRCTDENRMRMPLKRRYTEENRSRIHVPLKRIPVCTDENRMRIPLKRRYTEENRMRIPLKRICTDENRIREPTSRCTADATVIQDVRPIECATDNERVDSTGMPIQRLEENLHALHLIAGDHPYNLVNVPIVSSKQTTVTDKISKGTGLLCQSINLNTTVSNRCPDENRIRESTSRCTADSTVIQDDRPIECATDNERVDSTGMPIQRLEENLHALHLPVIADDHPYNLVNVPIVSSKQTTVITDKISRGIQCQSIDLNRTVVRTPRKKLRRKVRYLTKKLGNLRDHSKPVHLEKTCRKLHMKLKEIEIASENGDERALFLLEQIEAFGTKRHKWSENTVRLAVLWRAKSVRGYEFPREMSLLRLPSRSTLKRYIGTTSCEVGITSLILRRLDAEIRHLSDIEKICSLIIDEVAIQPSSKYVKYADKFVGEVDMGELGIQERLANRMLCFFLKGMSSKYRIPVAYFLTAQLDGEQLYRLTIEVLKQVENVGFEIVRIVTDNLKVNTNMFTLLGKGKLTHEIAHPLQPDRTLFLSFDYCHIIKNIYSQFLEREMSLDGQMISGVYVKRLHDMQKNQCFKPVRCLSKKHVEPSNLDKMNVKRAVQFFSPPVTAAIQTLALHGYTGFQNCEMTVRFMETIYKWFQMHDVCSTTQHRYMRLDVKKPFSCMEDDRLSWLGHDFPTFISNVEKCSKTDKKQFLTKETTGALLLTTRSTVATISHLLKSGFHYVLTRKFSSDDIESFFGGIRQMCGSNDKLDAISAVQAIEKVLITGTISTNIHGNVLADAKMSSSVLETPRTLQALPRPTDSAGPTVVLPQLEKAVSEATANFQDAMEKSVLSVAPPKCVESATIAAVSGYIVRVVQERISCPDCDAMLRQPPDNTPLMSLIRLQDRGKLIYPTRFLISTLLSVNNFALHVLPALVKEQKSPLLQTLTRIITPLLKPYISCSSDNNFQHAKQLCEIILTKFLKPLLTNYAFKKQESMRKCFAFSRKPVSRKTLKFS